MKKLVVFLGISATLASCTSYDTVQNLEKFSGEHQENISTRVIKNTYSTRDCVYAHDTLAIDSSAKAIEYKKAEDFIERAKKFDKE